MISLAENPAGLNKTKTLVNKTIALLVLKTKNEGGYSNEKNIHCFGGNGPYRLWFCKFIHGREDR